MKHSVLLGFTLGATLFSIQMGVTQSARAAETSAADSTKVDVGALAPAWCVQDLEGHPLCSKDFNGKVVVVDFWATWCGPCVSEIPGYVELQTKYREKGLVFVGLSLDEAGPEVVRKFVKARKMNYPIGLADSDVQSAFGGFEAIPTTFVIDREGRIRYKKKGVLAKAEFEAVLTPLLK